MAFNKLLEKRRIARIVTYLRMVSASFLSKPANSFPLGESLKYTISNLKVAFKKRPTTRDFKRILMLRPSTEFYDIKSLLNHARLFLLKRDYELASRYKELAAVACLGAHINLEAISKLTTNEQVTAALYLASIGNHTFSGKPYFEDVKVRQLLEQYFRSLRTESQGQTFSGRSIAIVGPASTEAVNGELIDSAEYVLRFNLRSRIPEQAQMLRGSKTDFIYFARRYIREGILYDIRQLKAETGCSQALVSKRDFERFNVNTKDVGIVGDYKFLFGSKPLSMLEPLAGLRTVVWAIQSGFSRVSVFNMDMYSGELTYHKGYLNRQSLRIQSIAFHDYYANLRFLSLLERFNYVCCDHHTKRALEMIPKKYFERLMAKVPS